MFRISLPKKPRSSPAQQALLWRKVHSLTGALALGGFLTLHLWTQGHALLGWSSFNHAMGRFQGSLMLWLEVIGIYLPLLYHAGYGISVSLKPRPNLATYPYRKTWAWVLQRVTGAVALVFIVAHFWQFRGQIMLGRMTPEDFFPELCASLSSTNAWGMPLVAFGYLIGTAACACHFANGLSGFCFFWGITRSRRTARHAAVAFGALGLGLFMVSATIIIYFATGGTPLDMQV